MSSTDHIRTLPELYTSLSSYYNKVCNASENKTEGALCRLRQLEARKGHHTYERLPGLNREALICGGHYDNIAPFESQRVLFQQHTHYSARNS